MSKSLRSKDYKRFRGRFGRDEVLEALSKTRISQHNATFVIQYLVEGVRLRDLGCSKQQAYARIKKVANILQRDKARELYKLSKFD